jgi:hypothetical protein
MSLHKDDRVVVDITLLDVNGCLLHGETGVVVGPDGHGLIEVNLDAPHGSGQRFIDPKILRKTAPTKPEWADTTGTVVLSDSSDSVWVRHSDGWRSTQWPNDKPRSWSELLDYTTVGLRATGETEITLLHTPDA